MAAKAVVFELQHNNASTNKPSAAKNKQIKHQICEI